ncbi:unnamed protein product [Cyprideis torosa]|uniref:Uncharacterized protein n=1 Tax=Cyprideis torosa TaxID=163714 RepID=A0A7R8ZS01_9CRUS|nr:unnamed protein product [Cyprideis torosa]CAG0904909.1 unnamed protein product [Cyprideis torosa]
MDFIFCLLLFWTLADASHIESSKIEDGPLHPGDDMRSISANLVEKTKIGNEPLHPKGDMRIINGVNAFLGQIPHQVSLQSSSGSHVCGGSIISQDWIVTAAHCVVGQYLSQMRVVSGTISLTSGGTIHTLTAGFYNGNYNPEIVVAH